MLELWQELLEALDTAASAHSGVDKVAPRANPLVVGLEIETVVEVERAAIAVKGRPDPLPPEHQVDAVLTGQEGTADRIGLDAAIALAGGPLDPPQRRPRPNRHAHDPLPLDDHPPRRRLPVVGLGTDHAKQQWQQRQQARYGHGPTIMQRGFAAKG